MISDAGLGALRVAATLTHSLPGLRALVGGPDGPLLEVAAPGRPAVGVARRRCSPCQFRTAVGRAAERTAAGERLAFLGLPVGFEPTVELLVPRGGSARAGGRYCVPVEGRWWWAFASTLPIDRAHELGRDLAGGWPDLPAGDQLRLRWDPLTQVTVAYVETSAAAGSVHEDEVIDLLDALLARWTVDELLEPLTGASAQS